VISCITCLRPNIKYGGDQSGRFHLTLCRPFSPVVRKAIGLAVAKSAADCYPLPYFGLSLLAMHTVVYLRRKALLLSGLVLWPFYGEALCPLAGRGFIVGASQYGILSAIINALFLRPSLCMIPYYLTA
jgi:hypothetical protein